MHALVQKLVSLPACQAVRLRGHGGPQPLGLSGVKERMHLGVYTGEWTRVCMPARVCVCTWHVSAYVCMHRD